MFVWMYACVYGCMRVCMHVHMYMYAGMPHSLLCVCMHARGRACVMLLLICFSNNCNLFKHLIFFHFVLLNNFVHLRVTLMVCFKANFLLRTVKYYVASGQHNCPC